MNIRYFTKDACEALEKAIDRNGPKYSSQGEQWLAEFFASESIESPYKISTIDLPRLHLEYNGSANDTKNDDDLMNVMTVYGSYRGKVTPAQAANPLLWTSLCHLEYRDYIMQRWTKEDGKIDIRRRFFVGNERASLYYYNAISRLWWAGYISYDEERENSDPWHLTRTLFKAQQLYKDFTDQMFNMSPTVTKGLLKALERIQDEIKGHQATEVFRKCCNSYLNHYAAVSLIDMLEENEIENLAYLNMKMSYSTS